MPQRINEDVLAVLRSAIPEGNELRLTDQLDRKLYERTNKVLEALGGKWNRKAKAHVFPADAGDLLGDVLATGEYLDAKREFQFYETPESLACRMCRLADIGHGTTVLEPSAGRGAIANTARQYGGVVHCSELQAKLADELQRQGFNVVQGDFLESEPDPQYDVVVMNPPFCRSQDIEHVRHAHGFLNERGRLVAVMGAGVTFRQDRKASEFREWLDSVGGEIEPLPRGTFKESGTDVNAVLVMIGI
jgi:protein-L-isoaspartate O-methyltransferase